MHNSIVIHKGPVIIYDRGPGGKQRFTGKNFEAHSACGPKNSRPTRHCAMGIKRSQFSFLAHSLSSKKFRSLPTFSSGPLAINKDQSLTESSHGSSGNICRDVLVVLYDVVQCSAVLEPSVGYQQKSARHVRHISRGLLQHFVFASTLLY